ncbi:hypothetical protein B1F69_04110 [Pseudomonas syringae]|uniref:DsbC family protein n=1 Tax=Pseudomonas syringae TaxID=317 RepID=UPI0010101BB2|nr:DsbC family protein [Pseudomonas syringae]RXU01268.1 hypothetical protein B1F69_04110 [Pseudomonas syringae]
MRAINPFQAEIKNDLMTVVANIEGHARVICLIELSGTCHFALDGQLVICIGELGQLVIRAPEGTDAEALLDCIASAVSRHKSQRKTRTRVVSSCFALVLTLVAAAVAVSSYKTATVGRELTSAIQPAAAQVVPQASIRTLPAAPLPVAPLSSVGPQEGPARPPDTPADGWTLPDNVRASLPAKLQMAADRKLFTVEYSSGHARTLYVFADPQCPNCQRLEPALEAAAKSFNVVVFPVAVIGREQSVASITPVLCLPPEQRKAAWSDLFDIGHGVVEPGEAHDKPAAEPGNCDIAGKALGVNEVAYQAYRIPGTPWAIADDGRHVSQEVLQNPLKLKAFMGAAEVDHAAR